MFSVNRVDIKTKPLDIVYNAALVKRVTEFFTVHKSYTQKERIELAGKHYIN